MSEHNQLLITGVDISFNRAIAEQAIQDGYHVIGTVCKEEERASFDASWAASSTEMKQWESLSRGTNYQVIGKEL